MKVKDILKTKKRANEILQVRISDSLAQAVAVMVENDTGSALIYDGGEFAGWSHSARSYRHCTKTAPPRSPRRCANA